MRRKMCNNDFVIQCASPEDPTKRYYRAFPALSAKDLSASEHQSSICMATPKSLTWPHGSSTVSATANRGSSTENYSSLGFGNTAGVKRKPKRRRNQAISKGKSSYGRKYNISATGGNSGGGIGGGSTSTSKTDNNSILWDTEFEGAWEMGRDLIREFVLKQNNNRNRSISESDASKFVEIKDMIQTKKRYSEGTTNYDSGGGSHANVFLKNLFDAAAAAATITSVSSTTVCKNEPIVTVTAAILNEPPPQHETHTVINDTGILLIGNNVMRDKGYVTPDTLTSLTEIDNTSAPRRLYEREVSNESINTAAAAEDAHHLALFEAKFNRSVEALWDDNTTADDINSNGAAALSSQPSNVDSFWYNYYKHHYNSSDQIGGDEHQPCVITASANPKSLLSQNVFGNQNGLSTQYQTNGVGGLASLKESIWSATDRKDDDLTGYSSTANLWDRGVDIDNSLQSSQVFNLLLLY